MGTFIIFLQYDGDLDSIRCMHSFYNLTRHDKEKPPPSNLTIHAYLIIFINARSYPSRHALINEKVNVEVPGVTATNCT